MNGTTMTTSTPTAARAAATAPTTASIPAGTYTTTSIPAATPTATTASTSATRRRVCLALPTNRECARTIAALHDEARYAAEHFDVEVQMLILDSSESATYTAHRRVVDSFAPVPNVTVRLLDEAGQRPFLERAVQASGLDEPERLIELMLPGGLSYGACTNRLFLIAAALGCQSVHRRDSDADYQQADDVTAYPIHHELSLGLRAGDVVGAVTESQLSPADAERTVTIAGASLVGEMSVDISEIEQLDPEVYHEVVSLWAPTDWTEERKRDLVAESFRGAGQETFVRDHSVLGRVDPMRIDMGNIAFHRDAYERIPLLPALDTIGSDYFLMHAVYDAGLPGVLHNRHVLNYYTPYRRTDQGFAAYQLRFVKFFLSMLYLNRIYERMGEIGGEGLLDADGLLRPDAVAALARESARLDTAENRWRLDVIGRCYRKLGGRYAVFAESVEARADELIAQARADIEEFAYLTERWSALVRGARTAAASLPPGERRENGA